MKKKRTFAILAVVSLTISALLSTIIAAVDTTKRGSVFVLLILIVIGLIFFSAMIQRCVMQDICDLEARVEVQEAEMSHYDEEGQ